MAKKENLNPAAGLFQSLAKQEDNEVAVISQNIASQTEKQISEPNNIKPTNELLVQRSYYITAKQYRALKLQAAIGDEKDMSAIVRSALDIYLADTLKKIN